MGELIAGFVVGLVAGFGWGVVIGQRMGVKRERSRIRSAAAVLIPEIQIDPTGSVSVDKRLGDLD